MRKAWFYSRILTLVLLLSLCVSSFQPPAVTVAAPSRKADDKPHLDKLVGAWNIDLTGPTHPPIPALLVFTSDGIVMGARPPLPFETPSYGNWITIDDENAAFTFMALTGSEKGPFSAKSKIRGTVHYDAATDSWRGPNHLDVYDPSGTLVFSDTGELSGTRIAVEALDTASAKKEKSGESEEQQEAANQAVVQRFYEEVVNQKKLEVFKEVFDPHMVAHELGITPYITDTVLLSGFPDLHLTVQLWEVKGDLVTAVVTVSGTQKAAILDLAPTGKKVTWSSIDTWRVKNGKITDVWHNFPDADILLQLGYKLVPPAK